MTRQAQRHVAGARGAGRQRSRLRQSRKARDLLKILVARRGRATPREVLMEQLWPEEDPLKVANRLSVALSTVRAVLDWDKRFNPDQFIISDKSTVALSLGHLDVDVEHFANDAAAGITAIQDGRRQEAIDRLEAAADRYVGDFLEEDITKVRARLRAALRGSNVPTWPSRKWLAARGETGLVAAIDRTGGAARWARELGLPLRQPGRRWTPEQIAVALEPLLAGRETWPSRREFEQAGLGGLYHAIRYGEGHPTLAARHRLPLQRPRRQRTPARRRA